jgi:hypothetical protein
MPHHRRRQWDPRGHVDEDWPDDDLTRMDHRVVMMVREALGSTIERFAPPESNKLVLATIAIAGLFIDVVGSFSAAPLLIALVNKQLAGARGETPALRNSTAAVA